MELWKLTPNDKQLQIRERKKKEKYTNIFLGQYGTRHNMYYNDCELNHPSLCNEIYKYNHVNFGYRLNLFLAYIYLDAFVRYCGTG